MKKQEQLSINREIRIDMNNLNVVLSNTPDYKMPPKVRLNHCQAWTQDFEGFTVLWSYNTAVAVYDKSTDTLYDILRGVYGYTATSAQHIAKFRHMCNPAHVMTYMEV